MKRLRFQPIVLGAGLALLTLAVTLFWGPWLQEHMLRPLVIGWVWFVFYVTHLPQAAVWFAMLFLAGLFALKPLKRMFPKRTVAPKGFAPSGLKGPCSSWQQVVTLALRGALYRRKLCNYLKDQLDSRPHGSPEAYQWLETMKPSPHPLQRISAQDSQRFLRSLHRLLDELEVAGSPHAPD